MARRGRRRRHGMSAVRKAVRKWGNLAFSVLGITVAASPSFRGIQNAIGGNPQGGMQDIVYDYTGYSIPGGNIDFSKTAQGVGTVVAGVAIARLGKWALRHF